MRLLTILAIAAAIATGTYAAEHKAKHAARERQTTGVVMESDLTWREKKAERELRDVVEGTARYVDLGVILRVVVLDEEHGEPLVPGNPNKVRVLREHTFGGMLDTHADPPHLSGKSQKPTVWYCSEDQEQILLHDDPDVPCQLIYGSEGAGKTHVLAMLHYLWWLELLGEEREAGQSAPTKKRTKMVLQAMRELYPARWFKYHKGEQLMTFVDGHRVQLVSTMRHSEAQGSPVQGYNWSRGGRDEFQDQLDAHEDIESRLRAARENIAPQAATCTAKEHSEFRTIVARLLGSGLWIKRLLLIERSPFVRPGFLATKKLVMTDREFRRRYKAEDLPPEHMVYFNWLRARNLKPIPTDAEKITSHVIRAHTGNRLHALLGGNDPGISKAATIYLDAYRIKGIDDPVWWVRGETVTFDTTTEKHALEVLNEVRRRGYNVPHGLRGEIDRIVHIRSHPYGQSEDKPSLNVYRILRRVGLDVAAAQHKKDGTGTGLISKEDRFEMINTLLFDAAERVRLYVEADGRGDPVAPRLVEAFETMERDEEGKAETEKKDEHDKSDPPAGLGYGLWVFEREAAQLARIRARERELAQARRKARKAA